MYNDSSLAHIPAALVSLATSLNTLSPRHKVMQLTALSFKSAFSSPERLAGICAPFKASAHLLWTNTALIFTFHNPKSLLPVNFSISNLEPMVPDYRFDPCPAVGANCCEFA
ncbi:hypothetical protein QL285_094815 [Trifolium repens]|nr:hypothetical protein QL285_094815 [Trifolium repens]